VRRFFNLLRVRYKRRLQRVADDDSALTKLRKAIATADAAVAKAEKVRRRTTTTNCRFFFFFFFFFCS
jgi:hypothetical protein